MNRVIKFRAWTEMGEMVDVSKIALQGDLFDSKPYILDQHNDVEYLENIVLMQFTGLTDEKGIEVYDGDLLSVPETATNIGGVHRVYYHNDGWVTSWVRYAFDDEYANKHNLGWKLSRGAVVVGNIHENPELLTNN